ncbi:MAG: ribonuclease P protein component [Gemmatimonadaceae bacterium]|nr:ribonuclease P protein component [Gemmatimonadaceae bacterium]
MTRGSELQTVARQGKRIRTEHLELRVVASSLHHARVGFIVPRYGQTAVARNRLKRRLREVVRCSILWQLPAVDLVIRARREAYNAPFESLRRELLRGRDRVVTLFAGS